MAARPHSSSKLLPLMMLVLVVAGLAWGLASAVASSPSASPAGAKVILKVGWSPDPDNLNPFVGVQQSS